ncbi:MULTISPECIES: VOC family protein [unclassified Kitasatospora]|uniref:VOC family protein n=1 Tax=unclassified Kitasatospora TaxID=2633591 RepID=UPI002473145F|nr:VOC family protein [Kitasatospora sp. MAP12-44]
MSGIARLSMVDIDCTDPLALAAFYSGLLGWEVGPLSRADYAMIINPVSGGAPIGFGQIEGHQPAPWPDPNGSKQFHLCFSVDDLAEATARAIELGASKPEFQPNEKYAVLLDPAGHPFCIGVAA